MSQSTRVRVELERPAPAIAARPVEPWPQPAILVAGLLLIVLYVWLLITLMGRSSFDIWGGLLVAPVLVVVSIPVLSREAAREGNRHLYWFLLGVLLLHLAVAWIGRIVAFDYYGGVADVARYDRVGKQLLETFHAGGFTFHIPGGVGGTAWPGYVNGIVYTFIGPTNLGGFFVYAWLGFWGGFAFYRAFRIAVPEGRPKTYARLLFLFPSFAFWSSFMGKDSWMVFGMGLAVYGAARALTGSARRGFVPLGIGLASMIAVRPHVAGMIGVAFAFAYLLRKPKADLRELAPVAKAIGLVSVAVLAGVLVMRTERFLKSEGIGTEHGLTSALSQTSEGSSYGGSVYDPPIVSGPSQFPEALVTVFFRPFPTETSGSLERMASVGGVFLFLLAVFRWRWGMAALLSIRRQPFVAFCAAYVVLCVIAFSAFANFGLLDRERVQLLPVFFVLLSIPPKAQLLRTPRRSSR